MNHDPISLVDRDGRGEFSVVIHLEDLACGRLDLESLVVAALHRIIQDGRVKRDLGAAGVVLDVRVEALIVCRFATPAIATSPIRITSPEPAPA